jgi:hypothetical protein
MQQRQKTTDLSPQFVAGSGIKNISRIKFCARAARAFFCRNSLESNGLRQKAALRTTYGF